MAVSGDAPTAIHYELAGIPGMRSQTTFYIGHTPIADADLLTGFSLLEQIENPMLHLALIQAGERERYIFLTRILEERSFSELAEELGISYKATTHSTLSVPPKRSLLSIIFWDINSAHWLWHVSPVSDGLNDFFVPIDIHIKFLGFHSIYSICTFIRRYFLNLWFTTLGGKYP